MSSTVFFFKKAQLHRNRQTEVRIDCRVSYLDNLEIVEQIAKQARKI